MDDNDNFNGLRMVNDLRSMKKMNTSGYKTHKKLYQRDINIRDYITNNNEKLLLYYDNKKSIFANQKCIHLEKELFNEIYNFIISNSSPSNHIMNYIIIVNKLLLQKVFNNTMYFDEGDILEVIKDRLTLYKNLDNTQYSKRSSLDSNLLRLMIKKNYKLFFICKPESSPLIDDDPLTIKGFNTLSLISDKLFNTILDDSSIDDNVIYISGSSESAITTASFLATQKSKFTENKFPENKLDMCYYFNKLYFGRVELFT